MSNTMPVQSSDARPSLERSGIRRSVQVIMSVLAIGALLFLSAGRLDWLWAISTNVYLSTMVRIQDDRGHQAGALPAAAGRVVEDLPRG